MIPKENEPVFYQRTGGQKNFPETGATGRVQVHYIN
jgi:hypothetical protein